MAICPGAPGYVDVTTVVVGPQSTRPSPRSPARGQQILRKLIDGRLLMTPYLDETPVHYRFEGTGTLVGLLRPEQAAELNRDVLDGGGAEW